LTKGLLWLVRDLTVIALLSYVGVRFYQLEGLPLYAAAVPFEGLFRDYFVLLFLCHMFLIRSPREGLSILCCFAPGTNECSGGLSLGFSRARS